MSTIDTIKAKGTAIGTESRPAGRRPFAFAETVIAHLARWTAKRRSRSALRDLTKDQLRDIGLTCRDVRHETAKSFFWD